MKFPRNARIFRGQLDAAPFAIVFFLLVMFLILGALVYTPGVRLVLPVADDLPGTDKPMVAVAIDAGGRLYYENQVVDEARLRDRLQEAAKNSPGLTLLVQADEAVTHKKLLQLTMLAREAGITESWLATLPRPLGTSP
ncbi:MAG TPA: biopolymer transporter ExbD [Verrucomicrobiae bacterium]